MILIAFYIAAAFLTQFMSNTATATVFATIAIVTAMSRGIDPRPFAVAIYAGATAAMLSPTSSPSIAIAFGAGHYRIVDVLKACIPPVSYTHLAVYKRQSLKPRIPRTMPWKKFSLVGFCTKVSRMLMVCFR